MYRLVNVFTAPDGSHGNPLGVFLDGALIPEHDERQRVATELGYSETVFVDDPASGRLHIFTPASELPLAGHPLVGSAWVIADRFGSCKMLRPPAGEVPTWQEGDVRWIRARPEWAPPFEFSQYQSPDEVDALAAAPAESGFAYCWAWIDEDAGLVRARSFVPEAGIAEDEATGSAALTLVEIVGRRPLEIHQGKGSLLHARPGPGGTVDVGGRVADQGEHSHGDG
jgi:predicted PhzF superfamily epimerase YddE/YHI9